MQEFKLDSFCMWYMYFLGERSSTIIFDWCRVVRISLANIYIFFLSWRSNPPTPWVTSTATTAERSITSGRSRIPMVMRRGNFYLFIYLFFCSVTNNCETSASLPALDTEAGQASPFPPGLNVLCTLIINGESSGDQTLQEHTGNGEVIHWYWNTHYLILKC